MRSAAAGMRGCLLRKNYNIKSQRSTSFFAFTAILCYNVHMLSVLLRSKGGYRFYYVLSDGTEEYGGGLTEAGELVCDAACPYKELMLRTLINKCMNEFVPEVKTKDDWGLDLSRFGLEERGGGYAAEFASLRLPHDCQ